jgi:hypothetical protein
MTRRPDVPCTRCGRLTWRESGAVKPAARVCQPCRRERSVPYGRRSATCVRVTQNSASVAGHGSPTKQSSLEADRPQETETPLPKREDRSMTDQLGPDDDGLHGINPLLAHAVEAFTTSLAGAFLKVWTRPDAVKTMERYLAGDVVFVVRLDELQVLRSKDVAPRPGGYEPGQYL